MSSVIFYIGSIDNYQTSLVMGKIMCLKIFVIVIAKEGLAGWTPRILLLVWHWLQNIICEGRKVQFYSRCHTQSRIVGALAARFPMTELKHVTAGGGGGDRALCSVHPSVHSFVCLSVDVIQEFIHKWAACKWMPSEKMSCPLPLPKNMKAAC